jgi:hypothetical protein
MIEMLATLLIVIDAPKGEMRMQFYIPTIEQCKQVEPALVQHFSRSEASHKPRNKNLLRLICNTRRCARKSRSRLWIEVH